MIINLPDINFNATHLFAGGGFGAISTFILNRIWEKRNKPHLQIQTTVIDYTLENTLFGRLPVSYGGTVHNSLAYFELEIKNTSLKPIRETPICVYLDDSAVIIDYRYDIQPMHYNIEPKRIQHNVIEFPFKHSHKDEECFRIGLLVSGGDNKIKPVYTGVQEIEPLKMDQNGITADRDKSILMVIIVFIIAFFGLPKPYGNIICAALSVFCIPIILRLINEIMYQKKNLARFNVDNIVISDKDKSTVSLLIGKDNDVNIKKSKVDIDTTNN